MIDCLRDIRTFIIANPAKIVGILLIIGVPIFHNLHNIFFDELKGIKVDFYGNAYYFSLAVLHSLAPALGFLGFIPFLKGKTKGLVVIPFGYELYKAIEKMPLQPNYTIYHEFWIASVFFMIAILPLGWLFSTVRFNINHGLRSEIARIEGVAELAKDGTFDGNDVYEENKKIAKNLNEKLELTEK